MNGLMRVSLRDCVFCEAYLCGLGFCIAFCSEAICRLKSGDAVVAMVIVLLAIYLSLINIKNCEINGK